jgi:hypothetical protein
MNITPKIVRAGLPLNIDMKWEYFFIPLKLIDERWVGLYVIKLDERYGYVNKYGCYFGGSHSPYSPQEAITKNRKRLIITSLLESQYNSDKDQY